MATIQLKNVAIEFPTYNVNARSFKKKFLRLATGGTVVTDANQHVVVRALSNLTLSINHGDRIGLVGHNGAGKSTLLRLLAGVYEPSSGDMLIDGHISAMLDLMHGMEYEFTGYENIIHRGILHGLTKAQIKSQMDEIAALTGLGDYLAMPMRTYSSGMMVRLAFAISASINPEVLLIDEIFNAGDANFVAIARKKMVDLMQKSSIVVMATHSDEIINEFCNKVLVLENGQIKFLGDPNTALKIYHDAAPKPALAPSHKPTQ